VARGRDFFVVWRCPLPIEADYRSCREYKAGNHWPPLGTNELHMRSVIVFAPLTLDSAGAPFNQGTVQQV
jgi:hypothetical protein